MTLSSISQILMIYLLRAAGPTLANKLLSLCLAHYRLASTTVTGIPMKEEQVRTVTNSQYYYVLIHLL